MTEVETWKSIPGFEGYYEVSDIGRVRGIERSYTQWLGGTTKVPSRIIAFKKDEDGYLAVRLYIAQKLTMVRVHRAVCLAFHPNPENKKFVNHKNGIKDDNRKSNVEWATQSENELHAYRTGLKKPNKPMLGRTGSLANMAKRVVQIDANGNNIAEFGSAYEAARAIGVDNSSISKAARNLKSKAGGYNWKYA